MKIEDYKTLISALPVGQQCFTTKLSTWRKAETEILWLKSLNEKLFGNQETLTICRNDIFNSNCAIEELIIKTLYWGYSAGMRGNHFIDISSNIDQISSIFQNLINKSNLTSSDLNELIINLKHIPGLGLSTYSKILYFMGIKFDGSPCLILDQRIIDVFNKKTFDEYSELTKIGNYNKERNYLKYITVTNKLADLLHTKGENIEQFLFLFGNSLKVGK